MTPLAGHLGPLLGDTAEKDVRNLLEILGYSIIREPNITPNIDKIIKFIGKPKLPNNIPCKIIKPLFSPEGIIAISIKKGAFGNSDVKDLLTDIMNAKKSDDETLKNINSGMILSNNTINPNQIDKILKNGIYCWDLTRLLFYASKCRCLKTLSYDGAIRENILKTKINATYIRQWKISDLKDNTIEGIFKIFIDEYKDDFIYSRDHHEQILDIIFNEEIKPLVEERDLNVYAQFEIHVLNIANVELIKKTHIDCSQKYIRDKMGEIKITFKADLPIYRYRTSPWSVLID